MKTSKEVCMEHKGFEAIVRDCIKNIGKDSIQDVSQYGADQGFPGFCYYSETVAFTKKHQEAIKAMLIEDSESFGETVSAMVASFRCLNDVTKEEVERYYLNYLEDENIRAMIDNALAWYALENVCRWFDE